MTAKLTIELVPKPLWKMSLAETLKRSAWDKLRRPCLEAAGHRCEICGKPGNQAHEVWSYDDHGHVQTLVRLICLCADCHGVEHWGRTTVVGYRAQALAHIKRVNGWNDAQVQAHEAASFRQWKARSDHPWTQDLSAVSL
jgi:5-methylcytosine-specific restriction endonuclease McrA